MKKGYTQNNPSEKNKKKKYIMCKLRPVKKIKESHVLMVQASRDLCHAFKEEANGKLQAELFSMMDSYFTINIELKTFSNESRIPSW